LFRIDKTYVKLSGSPALQTNVSEQVTPDELAERVVLMESGVAQPACPTPPSPPDDAAGKMMERARAAAGELMERARVEAQVLLQQAELEAQECKRLAWNDGYLEGKTAADADMARRHQADVEAFRNVFAEIERERTRMFDRMEREIIDLTFAMVKKIVNFAEETDDKLFESMIVKTLRQIKSEGKITIRVSSAEYEKYFSSGSATFILGGETVTASVVQDPALGCWDCVVDSDTGTVNAGLDSQLKVIRIAFDGAGGT
jgi:flagellar biosynthesis/type III secretory pathway protein FliH